MMSQDLDDGLGYSTRLYLCSSVGCSRLRHNRVFSRCVRVFSRCVRVFHDVFESFTMCELLRVMSSEFRCFVLLSQRIYLCSSDSLKRDGIVSVTFESFTMCEVLRVMSSEFRYFVILSQRIYLSSSDSLKRDGIVHYVQKYHQNHRC